MVIVSCPNCASNDVIIDRNGYFVCTDCEEVFDSEEADFEDTEE